MLFVLQIEYLAGWSYPSSVDMIKVLIRDLSAWEKAELIEKRLKRTQKANRRGREVDGRSFGGVGIGWPEA